MLIEQPFDVALAVRARRLQLKLRQIEVARRADVGREWLVDLEHGKPSVELGRVMRTCAALGLELGLRPTAPHRRRHASRSGRRGGAAQGGRAARAATPEAAGGVAGGAGVISSMRVGLRGCGRLSAPQLRGIVALGAITVTTSLDIGAEGQATYGMANLRPERTSLPFVVFISQRDDARHAACVKVSPAPKVRSEAMGSYGIAPFAYRAGWRLAGTQERALAEWVALNCGVLQDYWDGTIEYTEEAMERLRPISERR